MRRLPFIALPALATLAGAALPRPAAAQSPFLLELDLPLSSSYSVLNAVATPDGGFAVASGARDAAFLIKLDAGGGLSWFRSYDLFSTPGLALAADGGFILAGERASYADYVLLRTDENGDPVWARFYDSGSPIQGLYSVAEDRLGNIVASGIYTLRTDRDGNLDWLLLHVGGGGNVNRVRTTSDGGYVATGEGQYGRPAGDYNFVVTKLDTVGDTVFNRAYGGDGYDWGASVVATADGGFAACGWTRSFSAGGDTDAFLAKLEADGSLAWARSYDTGGARDSAHDLLEIPGEGYVLTGSLGDRVGLIRTDASGELIWAHSYGPGTGYAVVAAVGGGLFPAARSQGNRLFTARTDDEGLVDGCAIETPPVSTADAPFLVADNPTRSPASWSVSDIAVAAGGLPPAVTDTCAPALDDFDLDGVPDSSDNCVEVPNPAQEDADGDAVGDACDLCPDTPDPAQEDSDGDGAGDACDCAPFDASDSPPPAARDLRVGPPGHLSWTSPVEASSTDVHSGRLDEAWADLGVARAECLAAALPASAHDDPRPLVPGLPATGYYYLVAPRNACGATLAPDSTGGERAVTACP